MPVGSYQHLISFSFCFPLLLVHNLVALHAALFHLCITFKGVINVQVAQVYVFEYSRQGMSGRHCLWDVVYKCSSKSLASIQSCE